MYGIGLLGGGFWQNELILEFPTKSMPSDFPTAILDHWTAFSVRSPHRCSHSGARPQAESPESITTGQGVWIPGSPPLRYGARNDARRSFTMIAGNVFAN